MKYVCVPENQTNRLFILRARDAGVDFKEMAETIMEVSATSAWWKITDGEQKARRALGKVHAEVTSLCPFPFRNRKVGAL